MRLSHANHTIPAFLAQGLLSQSKQRGGQLHPGHVAVAAATAVGDWATAAAVAAAQ